MKGSASAGFDHLYIDRGVVVVMVTSTVTPIVRVDLDANPADGTATSMSVSSGIVCVTLDICPCVVVGEILTGTTIALKDSAAVAFRDLVQGHDGCLCSLGRSHPFGFPFARGDSCFREVL